MQKAAGQGFPELRRSVDHARRKQGPAHAQRLLNQAKAHFENDPRYWRLVGRIDRELGAEGPTAAAAAPPGPPDDMPASTAPKPPPGPPPSPATRLRMVREAAGQGQDALGALVEGWLATRPLRWGEAAYREAFRRFGEDKKPLALKVAQAWLDSEPDSLLARAAVAKILIKIPGPPDEPPTLSISDEEVAAGNPSHVANLLVLLGIMACRDRNMARSITPQLNRLYAARGLATIASAKGLDLEFSPSPPADDGGELVSIIMTAFNASKYIERSIRSLLNQSHRNFELIVIDDCSTDDTPDVVKQMAAADPRIVFRQNPRNHRQYWSRNHALELARGAYVAIQDADDIVHPDRIREQVRLLQDPALVACYVATIRVDDKFWVKKLKTYGPIHKALASLMYKRGPVGGKLGHFDEVRTTGDQEFHERMETVFGPAAIGFVGEPLYFLRWHKASVTQSLKGDRDRGISAIAEDYKKAFRVWHQQIAAGETSAYIASHPPSRPFEAPGDVVAR